MSDCSGVAGEAGGQASACMSSHHEEEVDSSSLMSIILFYKYHPLSPSHDTMEPYRNAMESLCRSLHLKGRILLGCSRNEGINGTLAGRRNDVQVFTYALLGPDYVEKHITTPLDSITQGYLQDFWNASREFAEIANVPPLTMDSPEDFKWSACTNNNDALFPDLVVKLVKEIIGTGGALASIGVEETSQGYLTPQEWHEEMLTLDPDDTVLIDCRNAKECAIGHFPHATDPHTTTFAQFPQWAQDHTIQLQEKKQVLMYCTGGIRCEKASAHLRRHGVTNVKHLKGGIHKYLECYGDEGTWKGKNFVFDGRGAAGAAETQLGKNGCAPISVADKDETVVGKCMYCQNPHDTFYAHVVCTVCREPVLACKPCQHDLEEYHCTNHFSLRSCYFTNLSRFSDDELNQQLQTIQQHLERIAVGKRYKQKRKTLQKQCDKIRAHLASDSEKDKNGVATCRNCGLVNCSGACWGFHGLKRKEVLEKHDTATTGERAPSASQRKRPSSNQRVSKINQKQRAIEEIQQLQLSRPPSEHLSNGIRVPPPCTRVLQTLVKGKWCGKPILNVLREEFADLSKEDVFQPMLERGLLRLNGEPLTEDTIYTKLKNMDVISRVVHWHEPPIQTPKAINVQKVALPKVVIDEYNLSSDSCLYVCDKPSSVPVHPAGPYLANSLTLMVEAQVELATRSLLPCHRIDRLTSGLTICCTDVSTARLIQSRIDEGVVRKLYLAKVKGHFPRTREKASDLLPKASSFAHWSWDGTAGCVEVDAPVETIDAGNGVRVVSAEGKPSRSRFQVFAYDETTDASFISCAPLTGRGHQLRVHMQWLGFPIDGDVSYRGRPAESNSMDIAIKRMTEAIGAESAALDSISIEDVTSAKSACRCCNGEAGIASSFTPAQLLNGSAICLHALRYEIPIRRRKRKNIEEDVEPLAVLSLEVGLPEWALSLEQVDVPWLLQD